MLSFPHLLSRAELCFGPVSSVVTATAILSSDLHVAFQAAQICVLGFSTVLAFYCGFIPLQFLPGLLCAFLCSSNSFLSHLLLTLPCIFSFLPLSVTWCEL